MAGRFGWLGLARLLLGLLRWLLLWRRGGAAALAAATTIFFVVLRRIRLGVVFIFAVAGLFVVVLWLCALVVAVTVFLVMFGLCRGLAMAVLFVVFVVNYDMVWLFGLFVLAVFIVAGLFVVMFLVF